jgi:2-polyprenyl-3-methyl-5-hydroxy-6-metoxy-1,4-benzoquinol methylase
MTYQEFKPCPLCGAPEQIPFAGCTDFMVSKESYTLMRCLSCGVVYTLDPPSEEEMKRYDKLNQKLKLGESPSGLIGRLYFRVRNHMLRRKAKLVETQAYRTNGSLLNYGAKTGFFSNRMERRGWKVTSVEKYHEERLFSLEMFHHRMIDIPEMENLHDGTFDVITLWHVFEHSHDPNGLLDRLYKLLRPGGILIMACPNIQSTDAMHYGPYWAAYDVPRHLWHFCPSSISGLALRHGFTLMHHERLPFDSFYISVLSEKSMRHRMAFIRGMAVGFRSWMVSLTRRGKSSSLVYVFRKRQETE